MSLHLEPLLKFFVLLPLAGFLASLFVPRTRERLLANIAVGAMGIHSALVAAFIAFWWLDGMPTLNVRHWTVFHAGDFEVFIAFLFDEVTAVFAGVGAVLTSLIAVFSRFYLHRERGYKRYFNLLMFFFAGYNLSVFSGNFETLFVGWEILGMTSFLLIAFYRDRYLPVRNAFKAISVYRLSDVALMLAMWSSHHWWHRNITFFSLHDHAAVQAQLAAHGAGMAVFCAIVVIIAAAAKSGMAPFSAWVPRAMEGPTTSSAIYYGSLSVHIGPFLLLRTYELWESLLPAKIAIIAIGLVSSFLAAATARVQATVKSQIAYSSITQIGLVFVEIALGYHTLALVHVAGNAFLRCYQLLVSPSVLNYLIHEQFYHAVPTPKYAGQAQKSPGRIWRTLYALSLKEWNFDEFLYRVLWHPMKVAGRLMDLSRPGTVVFLVLTAAALAYGNVANAVAFFAVVLILNAFAERKSPIRAWIFIYASMLLIGTGVAVGMDHPLDPDHVWLYLGGSGLAFVTGLACLKRVEGRGLPLDLGEYHGLTVEAPKTSLVFLLCCLGILGFPITPTFIGVDLLLTRIGHDDLAMIAFTAISLVLVELAALRIYARVFLGPNKKEHHPVAYRLF